MLYRTSPRCCAQMHLEPLSLTHASRTPSTPNMPTKDLSLLVYQKREGVSSISPRPWLIPCQPDASHTGQRKVSTFKLGKSDSLAAVIGISQGMADFLGPYGIRVNTVSPAVVASSIMGPDRIVSGVKRPVNGKWFIQFFFPL